MKSVTERQLQRPNGYSLPFRLTRMRRKTLSIRISEEGIVDVRIPNRASLRETEDFLLERLPWIDQQLSKAIPQALRPALPNSQDTILWRGKPLRVTYSETSHPVIEDDCLYLPDLITVKQLKSWSHRAATGVLHDRIDKVMHLFTEMVTKLDRQRMPSSWKLRWVRSRWGSCNSDGQINLNLRLAIFDDKLIDAVIYHELCHLFVLNHSNQFYQLLAQLDPDYNFHSTQLRQISHSPIAQLSWHWLAN
jgi:predicted metal-dependent hydrolase